MPLRRMGKRGGGSPALGTGGRRWWRRLGAGVQPHLKCGLLLLLFALGNPGSTLAERFFLFFFFNFWFSFIFPLAFGRSKSNYFLNGSVSWKL